MFKKPTQERINLIADMIPEAISVFTEKSTGYSARIAKLGEMARLMTVAKELGINPMISKESMNPKSIDYVVEVLKKSYVPPFALVMSKSGRCRISFANDETDAPTQLIRMFPDECILGNIYVFSDLVTKKQIKTMMTSGAETYFNIKSKSMMIL